MHLIDECNNQNTPSLYPLSDDKRLLNSAES